MREKESIHSATISGESVISFRPSLPIRIAALSPNWSEIMPFQLPSWCRLGIDPFCYHFWRKCHILQTFLANSKRSSFSKLVRDHAIPATLLVSTHKCTSHEFRSRHLWQQVPHLEMIPRDVSGVVVVASYSCMKKHLQAIVCKKLHDHRYTRKVNPMSANDCMVYTSDVNAVSGWEASVSGPNTRVQGT